MPTEIYFFISMYYINRQSLLTQGVATNHRILPLSSNSIQIKGVIIKLSLSLLKF